MKSVGYNKSGVDDARYTRIINSRLCCNLYIILLFGEVRFIWKFGRGWHRTEKVSMPPWDNNWTRQRNEIANTHARLNAFGASTRVWRVLLIAAVFFHSDICPLLAYDIFW